MDIPLLSTTPFPDTTNAIKVFTFLLYASSKYYIASNIGGS